MQQFSIPICYFPSTVLFVDDSHDFLLNFVLQLDEGVAYRIFDAPLKALNYLHNKRCELDVFSQSCLRDVAEAKNNPLSKDAIPIDFEAIYAEVYNPHRFSEISVVVVDEAMPGMKGIEFCRHIDNSAIKKILLIGPADEELAMAALHEGLIHRYIKKNDYNAVAQISKSIRDLQFQYFQTMSEMLMRILSITPPACLHDKTFLHYFSQLREQKKIIEYYLVNHSGGFFMLDVDAKPSLLIVKESDHYLQENADLTKFQQKIRSYHDYLEALDTEELLLV